jgi:hypothetical protein
MAYISVADAVERTGRGHTTIYRLCRKHEHTKYVMREDKKFLIDENFLSNHYTEQEQSETEASQATEPKQELVDAFINELLKEKEHYRLLIDHQNEQLARKDTVIAGLQERHRELYQLLYHQTRLLEEANKTAQDARDSVPVLQEQDSTTRGKVKPGPTTAEISTVYAVLAFVALLLTFAIAFHEELRIFVAE